MLNTNKLAEFKRQISEAKYLAATIKARTSNNSDTGKGPNTTRGGQEVPSIEIFGKYGGKTARSISAKRDFRTMSKVTYVPDDKNGTSLLQ